MLVTVFALNKHETIYLLVLQKPEILWLSDDHNYVVE